MAVNEIDAALLKTMFLAGAQNLESKKEWINELNVFPVPDGDTGTNMTLTIMSAAREVQAIEQPDMQNLAKAISSGSLRGARGNSGVILSQLFRGLTKEIKTVDVITTQVLARAFQRATETAYKAVMKPKEGTILTVAKGMADKAAELAEETEDMESFLRAIIEHGDLVLSQTPQMLPVLKQAGVVDSGGQGLMEVMKGALDGYLGKEISLDAEAPSAPRQAAAPQTEALDIKFGYCTEFIINLEKTFDKGRELDFKGFLESIGDSIVLVADDDLVKVHVHTNDPGLAIQRALEYGSLSRIKIDNMREEHQEKLIKDAEKMAQEQKTAQEAEAKAASAAKKEEPRREVGFIAVSIGEGLKEIFRGLNVDYLIEGGQTMNPSTDDMLNAIDQVNADTIYIFPNNKNIILAAEQAMHLTEDKKIVVIPSKTIPQGITGIINFVPGHSAEENKAAMTEEMAKVKTGQVTYAVRDTSLDGFDIREGDIMGIGDHGILSAGGDIETVSLQLLKNMLDEDSELVSIYYGSDVDQEAAEAFFTKAQELSSDVDMELHFGGQPIYYYIISVE